MTARKPGNPLLCLWRYAIAGCLLISSISPAVIRAQETSIFDKLSEQEKPIRISISTDLEALINERRGEDPLPATLSFSDAQKNKYALEVDVSSRGKFRRRICDFPPLRLDFSRRILREQGFVPAFRKLKLVTHCLDDMQASKDNVLKEYLAYKIYSELTGYGFRAQLTRIDYLDTEKKVPRIRRYGIFLEDMDELVMRLGGEECKNCYGIPTDEIDAAQENLLCVFQYMIGNTDWNVAMVRNIKILTPAGGGEYIPIPYDFDFAGFVNPSYAIPNANFGLTSTTQRIFLGQERGWPMLAQTLERFVEKKAAIMQMIRSTKLLSFEARLECIGYLEGFYAEIEELLASKGAGYPGTFKAWEGN